MNESTAAPRLSFATPSAVCWTPEPPPSWSVRPASRTELRGALEANEVFFSLLEITPDYSHCGINE